MRKLPNIIITGTPGTGKSAHSERLVELMPKMAYVSINKYIKDYSLEDGFDEERQSTMVDEDKLVDLITPDLEEGGRIIDWHVCDIFPESLIDLVVVLRASTTRLFDRLKDRNYPQKKFIDNMDSEIMEIILNDARESYDPEIVIELYSNDNDDLESNCQRIEGWAKQWIIDNDEGTD
ncbi:AAA domain-containing protein [Lipomyces doorenjongii]|uniref:AAA domain-containing protein n=1 Tax=Lipomyces doorenjongii TaxID=383834 RepID=UPI0034CE1C38